MGPPRLVTPSKNANDNRREAEVLCDDPMQLIGTPLDNSKADENNPNQEMGPRDLSDNWTSKQPHQTAPNRTDRSTACTSLIKPAKPSARRLSLPTAFKRQHHVTRQCCCPTHHNDPSPLGALRADLVAMLGHRPPIPGELKKKQGAANFSPIAERFSTRCWPPLGQQQPAPQGR